MKQIALTEFKRKSSAYVRWVAETRQTLQVTHEGKIYVEVVPIPLVEFRATRAKKLKQK